MLRDERGFTLVEMLAAVVFLAICLAALASLPIAGVKANSHARHVTAATNLALDKIEDLRGTAWASLDGGADATPLAGVADADADDTGDVYSRSWAVQTGPVATTKEVSVTVRWHDLDDHAVVLRTVISE
jgi:prepilin-type N-terminal cleavage/methylation domain-containing protein